MNVNFSNSKVFECFWYLVVSIFWDTNNIDFYLGDWVKLGNKEYCFNSHIWTFEAQKNTIFGIPNIICSKSIQKWLIIWERAYIFLNHGSNFLNLGHSGQENITSGYYGPSIMWPGSGRATQKPWPTGQISGRVLAQPSPTLNRVSSIELSVVLSLNSTIFNTNSF